MSMTITEALAEIKTIGKRLEKKREGIYSVLARQAGVKDPYEKEGGTPKFIAGERQSIHDLEERIVYLRAAIQAANTSTILEVCGEKRTIADWLIWRREVSTGQRDMLFRLRGNTVQLRKQAMQGGQKVLQTDDGDDPRDIIIHIDEVKLAAEIDQIENVLGTLDGQLSVANATVLIKEE